MSTPDHTVLSVQQFLTKNVMTPMPHPPNSPDLTPSDLFFCLFPLMKRVLKGKHFATAEEMKQKTAKALKGITIDKFKNCFEQWEKRLDRWCTASNGEYFEDNRSLNM